MTAGIKPALMKQEAGSEKRECSLRFLLFAETCYLPSYETALLNMPSFAGGVKSAR